MQGESNQSRLGTEFFSNHPVLDASAEMIENGTFGWLESRADSAVLSKLLKVSD